MDENVILKIKKLLALSNSSNENESKNAMLKAQRLMLEHKLTMRDIESHEEINISSEKTNIRFRVAKWKAELARVIASNFGTKLYYTDCRAGSKTINFFGKEEDVTLCGIMMEYAVKCIKNDSKKLINKLKKDKRWKHFDRAKTDYALGFIQGLKERFEEQLSQNEEWGLVLQIDPIVVEKYEEMSKDWKKVSVTEKFNNNAGIYNRGREEGKKFDISDKIENEGKNLELEMN